jgi:TorA maturation chaperone TorD
MDARLNETHAALAAEDADRAGFYALIAHLMAHAPAAETLAAIAAAPALEPDPALPEAVALAQAWQGLQRAAADGDAGTVAAEWAALFTAPGRPLMLPYASFFLTGFLMEKPLAALRDEMAALGLAREAGCGEPEDHLAGVCDVMRVLVERGDWAAQQGFFSRHLQPWVADCCRALTDCELARFYSALAAFAHAFFMLEARVLGYEQ